MPNDDKNSTFQAGLFLNSKHVLCLNLFISLFICISTTMNESNGACMYPNWICSSDFNTYSILLVWWFPHINCFVSSTLSSIQKGFQRKQAKASFTCIQASIGIFLWEFWGGDGGAKVPVLFYSADVGEKKGIITV